MTYLRANKRPGKKKTRAIYSTVGIVVLILVAVQLIYPHFIPSVFTSFLRPFWTARFSVTAGSLETKESILLKNEDMNRKISEYEVRLATIAEIEQENQQLKDILGRPEKKEPKISTTSPEKVFVKNNISTTSGALVSSVSEAQYSFLRKNIDGRILAAVLIRPPGTKYDEYIIDIGSDFGVKVNDKVYAPGDVLVGKVVDVLSYSSRVMLYSSPGEKYEVTVGSANNFSTAVGRGGGQYEVVLPRDAVVSDGDFVNSPSLSDRPFGVVTAVLSNPADPFETVLFTSTVNIYNMRWVLVGNKK